MESLLAYLDASPSPWHAVGRRPPLDAAGFTALDERDSWADVPRPVTSCAAAPDRLAPAGDGPTAADPHRRRPHRLAGPARQAAPGHARAGWRQLGVEIYGGVLLNSWLDRDLGIAGRVVLRRRHRRARRRRRADRPRPAARHPPRPRRQRARPRARPAGPHDPGVGDGADGRLRRRGWPSCRLARRHPGVVGAVPVRRAAGRRARRRPLAAGQRAARQPGVVLGGDDGAGRLPSPGRPRGDDRPVRPRGGRLGEHDRRVRAVPRP